MINPEQAEPPRELENRQARVGRVKGWVHTRQDRIDAARNTSQTVEFAFQALSYDTDTGAPVLAAALAFRVFLFQVPFACLYVIVVGFIADLTGRDAHSFFHGNGIARLTAESVVNAASLSGWARFTAFVVVAYALFLSARSFVKVVNIVHALVWNLPRRKVANASRAALTFIGCMTVLFALSLLAVNLHTRFQLQGLVVLILYSVVPFALWWLASWRLPHQDCPLIALLPGAALFAVGVELLHLATVLYLPHLLESKSEVYGTVGVSLTFLFWAYLVGRLITLSAVLNAALWARYGPASPHPLHPPTPPDRIPIVGGLVRKMWRRLFGVDDHVGLVGLAEDVDSPGDDEPDHGQ